MRQHFSVSEHRPLFFAENPPEKQLKSDDRDRAEVSKQKPDGYGLSDEEKRDPVKDVAKEQARKERLGRLHQKESREEMMRTLQTWADEFSKKLQGECGLPITFVVEGTETGDFVVELLVPEGKNSTPEHVEVAEISFDEPLMQKGFDVEVHVGFLKALSFDVKHRLQDAKG